MSQLRLCRLQLRLSGGDRRVGRGQLRLRRGQLGRSRRPFLHCLGAAFAQLVLGVVDLLFGIVQLPLRVGKLLFGCFDFVLGLVDFLALLAAYCRFAGFWLVREQRHELILMLLHGIAVFGAPVVQSLGVFVGRPGDHLHVGIELSRNGHGIAFELAAAGRGLSHVEAGQSLAGPDETDDGEFVVA